MNKKNKTKKGVSIPVEKRVSPMLADKWQTEKPDRPCLFIHRWNNKDERPTMSYAVLDCDVLCVTDVELNEFTSTMEEYADGEFFIVGYM